MLVLRLRITLGGLERLGSGVFQCCRFYLLRIDGQGGDGQCCMPDHIDRPKSFAGESLGGIRLFGHSFFNS